jgi:hypothetical protein
LAAATVDAATDALTDGFAASLADGAVVVVRDELGEAPAASMRAGRQARAVRLPTLAMR